MGWSATQIGESSLGHFSDCWRGFHRFHCTSEDDQSVAPPTTERHLELVEKYKDV